MTPFSHRLNLSYNAISKFGPVTSFPLSVKHLDLSYNQINDWPGDSSVGSGGAGGNASTADLICYAQGAASDKATSAASEHLGSGIKENKKYSR